MVHGECVCEANWSGEDCRTYNGVCHPRCQGNAGCQGNSHSDCNYCNEHSVWDTFRNCVCLSDWTGDDCNTFIGACDSKCATCKGPFSTDCLNCVP
jgi:hypothetical protein